MAGFMKGWGGMDVGRADGEQERKEGRRRKEPLPCVILALSSYSSPPPPSPFSTYLYI